MHSDPIKVSAIVPAYRARACITRAIDSALAQTIEGVEVLVVDDASDDGTAEFVRSEYRDRSAVRVLTQRRNGGPARARNVGIEAARGEWVAILDADDSWRAERLACMLADAAHADAVFDNIAAVDPMSRTIGDALFPQFPARSMTPCDMLAMPAPGSAFDFGYLKPIIRRSFLEEHAIVYDESLRTGEDLLLYLTVMLEGARVRTIDQALYLYTLSNVDSGSPQLSHTRPRDRDVREALNDLRDTYRDRLSVETAASLAKRIDGLEQIAPISDFYYARRRRQYVQMAALLIRHGAVQREIVAKVATRLAVR